jgi:hypothetical protein
VVEHHLAKVGVAGSNPVVRSRETAGQGRCEPALPHVPDRPEGRGSSRGPVSYTTSSRGGHEAREICGTPWISARDPVAAPSAHSMIVAIATPANAGDREVGERNPVLALGPIGVRPDPSGTETQAAAWYSWMRPPNTSRPWGSCSSKSSVEGKECIRYVRWGLTEKAGRQYRGRPSIEGGAMRRTLIVGAVTMAIGLASVPMATAITFGEPDENRHPNVGAMLADFGGDVVPFCSGSLIASDVFLTAAHCIVGVEQIAEEEGVEPEFLVSFDEELGEFPDGVFDIHGFDLAPGVELISGTPFFDERFGTAGASQPFDIAVILLDTEPGIQPVDLPTEGFLSGLKAQHDLTSQTFTAV